MAMADAERVASLADIYGVGRDRIEARLARHLTARA